MNTGIFLAGLGIFIYCVTASFMEVNYFVEMDPNNNRIIKIVPIVHPFLQGPKSGKLVSVIINEMEVRSGGLKRYIKSPGVYVL